MRLKCKHWIPAFAGMTFVVFVGFFATLKMTEAAEDCLYMDGGYCVSKMTGEIAALVGAELGETNAAEGVKYFQRLEFIWNVLMEKKLAVKEDMDRAFVEAGNAGGTKIGGVNLIVLSAWTLQQMVDKNIITRDDAQKILSGAR